MPLAARARSQSLSSWIRTTISRQQGPRRSKGRAQGSSPPNLTGYFWRCAVRGGNRLQFGFLRQSSKVASNSKHRRPGHSLEWSLDLHHVQPLLPANTCQLGKRNASKPFSTARGQPLVYNSPHGWPLPLAPNLVPMKFNLRWVQGEWGKCIGRGTRAWTAPLRSRFFRHIFLRILRRGSGLTAKPAPFRL